MTSDIWEMIMDFLLNRRRPIHDTRQEYGLSQEELRTLAQYNSEVGRGIVHTEGWKSKMQMLQRLFDDSRDA